MVVRVRVVLSVLILFVVSCSAVVFAQSNGNINVEVTKLDNGLSYMLLLFLGLIIVAALVFSLILVLRRKPVVRPRRSVGLRQEADPIRGEGYYSAVFESPKKTISDEKSEPASFADLSEDKSGVERYLKEDERIVVNVLKQRNNSSTQATLRVVTDFSKAKLSRILSELEQRGVVYKEQQGRKNIITLKA